MKANNEISTTATYRKLFSSQMPCSKIVKMVADSAADNVADKKQPGQGEFYCVVVSSKETVLACAGGCYFEREWIGESNECFVGAVRITKRSVVETDNENRIRVRKWADARPFLPQGFRLSSMLGCGAKVCQTVCQTPSCAAQLPYIRSPHPSSIALHAAALPMRGH